MSDPDEVQFTNCRAFDPDETVIDRWRDEKLLDCLAVMLAPPWWLLPGWWVLYALEHLARVAGRWSPHARRQLLRVSVWIAGGLYR